MAKLPAKVEDPQLRDWLVSSSDEPGELIVEASVPRRAASVGVHPHGRVIAKEITGDRRARLAILEELGAYLAEMLSVRPTLLRSAGAFAVRANPREARRITEHRLVKNIRRNRRLHPGPWRVAHR